MYIFFFQIGFISEITQDSCSKTSRILIAHITSRYPNLLSQVLHIVKNNMDRVKAYSLYLYEELPLSIWVPSEEDIRIISNFLLTHPHDTNENRLARMILSRLNWHLVNPGELFLPYHVHCQVALLILEAVQKEPACTVWAWQTILRLRLHISDMGFTNFSAIKEVEQYDIINRGKLDLHSQFILFSVKV